ncbi:ATP-dependent helicase HrpB [Paraferrimonas sedimenticola]|uniref:ATP-dependent helicase HrpB n=1 Tax=Paraferrimonas sedimenticola TaxID=375674 RepID=A0AA37RU84_9GAMM|nr:ATP-dependent helicase HrpB [Paraferrimonas sedimenticola]GLP95625.1 ATP-dependent helicase HrpB [Paraferrimonas sedimenticola]
MNQALPIAALLGDIQRHFQRESNLVLQAQPGAGKSTQVPLALMEQDYLSGQKILMLEPRRLAAKSLATYLAACLGEEVGQRIGYQIRHESKRSAATQVEIVTEGILTRRLQSDPELSGVGLVIFDEFHERSIHSDLGLMFCLEAQQALRDDLKLLVMSATIDTDMVSEYLGGAKVMHCPGRTFPVSCEYADVGDRRLEDAVALQVKRALAQDSGDILVFLPGAREIQAAKRAIEQLPELPNNTQVLPLYGSLPFAEQQQAIQPAKDGIRKVILATNIAETSLTIDGITQVIDSGLERFSEYDPSSGMTRLQLGRISKASAEQRLGRAGRTRAGHGYRLWRESQQAGLSEFQTQPICREDLCSTVLELMMWGFKSYADVPWLTPPNPVHFDTSMQLLQLLGLVSESGQVTANGETIAGLGIEPRLGAMLLAHQDTSDAWLACQLAALLSERDVLSSRTGVDIEHRLKALSFGQGVHPMAKAAIKRNAKSWAKRLRIATADFGLAAGVQIGAQIGAMLLHAFPDRVARQRQSEGRDYTLYNGKSVALREEDPMRREPWLVVADCDGQRSGGRIYLAASVTQSQVMEHLGDRQQKVSRYFYDGDKGQIRASTDLMLGRIRLANQSSAKLSPEQFVEALGQLLPEHGLEVLQPSDKVQFWLKRVRWLAQYNDQFQGFEDAELCRTIDQWMLAYYPKACSIRDLKAVDWQSLLNNQLSFEQQQDLAKQAPSHYRTPSGKSVPIEYHPAQGPKVSVVLQEVFGELSSPLLGFGQVPLCFELLSPARRPIQTTSDLANFWGSSYFEVAKDMRGRYPKHRWPEEPLLEKAGRSIKKKG